MRLRRFLTCSVLLWFLIIMYVSYSEFIVQMQQPTEHTEQMHTAMAELQKMRDQNKELMDLVKTLEVNLMDTKAKSSELELHGFPGPSLAHEKARRKVDRVSLEFWFFLKSELNKLKSQRNISILNDNVNQLLTRSGEYQTMVRTDFHKLANDVDNLTDWRLQESLKLGDLVQRRLQYLQNPTDCNTARKLVCGQEKGCGYACRLHHTTYCLLMAYAMNRTLVNSKPVWPYSAVSKTDQVTMKPVFQPLSNNCFDYDQNNMGQWASDGENNTVQTLKIFWIDGLHPQPDYLPLAVPDDLADRLARFHGNPAVWWIGQFVRYLTRPRDNLQKIIAHRKKSLGFERPIVGVHIRRTDKLTSEAAAHPVEEYMLHVEEWFNLYEKLHPGTKRRVFLASDDPDVLEEAQKKYSNYTFIIDAGVAQSAKDPKSRVTEASKLGIIQDIHFLSLCDYLVCTFSSQVCRAAYEMMQTMHGDASEYFKSLDDMFYFGGQNSHFVEVIEAHVNSSDDNTLDILPGDHIDIAGNHWDGYSKGKNNRTGQTGLFPSYKTVDTVKRVKMPTYPEVKEES